MIEIKLPDKPVDKYKVKYYCLSMSEYWVYINKMEGVYYINTPWNVYRPNTDSKGVPLVDDWMISKDGTPEGRICGWENILKVCSENAFATREEAIRVSIERLDRAIFNEEQRVLEIQRLRDKQKRLLK